MSPAASLSLARLMHEEGKRAFAYDDATGLQVHAPKGVLTIGYGINLEKGLDEDEQRWLLEHRLGLVELRLLEFPWYSRIDAARQSVLLDVGYNVGVAGLMRFVRMLEAFMAQDWPSAAAQLLDSKAARSAPTRYRTLANILKRGVGA